MKKNRLIAAALALVLLVSLSGCQLAKTDQGEPSGETADRLIGAFITREPLDLFDFESYMNDNAENIVSGGQVDEADAAKYQGRLYAAERQETNPDGTKRTDLIFEGVEGIRFFAPTLTDEEGQYTANCFDEAIQSSGMHITAADEGTSVELEGTIYMQPASGELVSFYINPVYQSGDGRVYALTGSGMSSDTNESEGSMFSQTIEDTTTVTADGEKQETGGSVKIDVSVMFCPEKIVLLQMDGDSSLLSRDEYRPGTLPEKLTAAAGTEYIIAETHKKDSDGKTIVTRQLLSKDDEGLTTFYGQDDGLCAAMHTELEIR